MAYKFHKSYSGARFYYKEYKGHWLLIRAEGTQYFTPFIKAKTTDFVTELDFSGWTRFPAVTSIRGANLTFRDRIP